ncbi:metal dependent phosphohydrolase with HDIG domain [Gottschalkia acidurici 9a]|uniref:Metal dependent phosphohydrolase with HDIG domain n=1 Tax=Gottschalkia acidurici (strain ATCC 7906 / DSM 604 / BCRC 14475 / CIP 104303 / KCTC 5404 / NCIMB 10678 / 9a) TaxID=1128398 RepID=K0B2T6_GOTA9|nr:HDIG domain-containing metalloprotein [Gottschalkia acidurici]AFS78906.1 metal dependent phosphohydrolase with HDIG domain [Gottschalkia acidurici 9a]
MKREEALVLLKNHVKTDRVFRHSLAVEAAVMAYAEKFGQDKNYWGLLGLLHDIDFEKYPEEHPNHAPAILEAAGFDKRFIESVLSHCPESNISRDSKERQCLYAVDEMASFIIAIALMRPTKLEGLNAKSVKKKMKDKAFAKAVNRDKLISSAEELEVDFVDHINTIVNGLIAHEAKLQAEGYSLLD